MSEQWGESEQQATREATADFTYGSRDGKVFCKHINGGFGQMYEAELIGGRYAIYSPVGGLIAEFKSVDAMISDGWVLD